MVDIRTARVQDKVFAMNGVDPIAYIDLTKVNKGSKAKAIIRFKARTPLFKIFYRIKK